MSANPAFADTPCTSFCQVSTANTARDGSGTLATLISAAAAGTRVDDIAIVATGTTTAGMLRMFLSDGSNTRLLREIPVAAVTPSASVATWSTIIKDMAMVLKTGWSIKVSTHNAEVFNLHVVRGGDL